MFDIYKKLKKKQQKNPTFSTFIVAFFLYNNNIELV